MDSKKRRRWLLNAIDELVPNFDWQTGLCMSFSSWDALFCDAIFFKKKSYALQIMHRRKLVSRENFPQKFTHRTVCSTTHSPQISPTQSSPVSIVTRYIFQNMLDHKRSYPEVVKGGALSGVGHMYSSMQAQVSDH